ncbi:MAG TPA: hypothetical protein VGM02_08410 [Acidobacteriaceae bacterium]|jgi:hypothetical protein
MDTESTTNVFQAVLGAKAIKWDAFWHLFEWLLNVEEGHVGDRMRNQLVNHAFDERDAVCTIKREYPVSGQTDGKGKWADFALGIPNLANPKYLIVMDDIAYAGSGGMRKLNNLSSYLKFSIELRPDAAVRVIAVTDAPIGQKLKTVVYQTLGQETAQFDSQVGWKLLPLQTIGSWIQCIVGSENGELSDKMKMILGDLTEWCNGLKVV